MRKFSIITCLIIVFLSLCLSASTPAENNTTFKTIYPSTNLYTTSSLQSEVLITIPQNVIVTVINEPFYQNEILWQEVDYEKYNGYVLYNNLYVSMQNDTYTIKIVKATSANMGKDILLYESHDTNSQSIAISDGTKLNLIVNDIDYGIFSKVEYEGKAYYVVTAEITNGLSYNQTLAVIIVSALCGVILIIALVIIIKRKNRLKKY